MKRRIYAKKSLGQHYLRDKNIKNKIIKSLDLNQNDTVVEIGCGRGALTDLIIEKVLKFYGIELDENLFMNLREKYQNENVEMINQDARSVDISELLKNQAQEIHSQYCMKLEAKRKPTSWLKRFRHTEDKKQYLVTLG